MLPAKFKIGNQWFTIDGSLKETSEPRELSSNIFTNWSYVSLPNLLENGVYSSDSINKMRNMVFEQEDRRVASSILHKVLSGKHPNYQGFNFGSLNGQEVSYSKLKSIGMYIYNIFLHFGLASATLLGVMIFYRVIKTAYEMLINRGRNY